MDDLKNSVNPDEELDEDVVVDEEKATPEQLATIVNLARAQYKLKQELAAAEAEVERINKLLNINMTKELVDAMQAAKLNEAPLGNGVIAKLEEKIRASIPSPDNKKNPNAAEDNAKGIAYMDQYGPDLVKNLISIEFDRGDQKFFEKFLRDLKQRKRPVDYEMKRTVHSSTLTSWVEKRLEKAEPVDDQVLNIQRTWVADVKLPKEKKNKDAIKT